MGKGHKWSNRSERHLASCDTRLRDLMNEVLTHWPYDMTVIEGHRSDEKQREMFETGRSKLGPGESKHNLLPSEAVDVAPLTNGKIDWNNRELWLQFAGFIRGIAATRNLEIRWGGDWDSDFNSAEHQFFDAPHFEIVETR